MSDPLVIVHDYLVSRGGAERTLLAMHDAFPDAPVYTSVYSPTETFPEFKDINVVTSWLQQLRLRRSNYRFALGILPRIFAGFKFRAGTVILSSASAFAKCVPNPGRHICYCYTPPRFLWDVGSTSRASDIKEVAARVVLGRYLRSWDLKGARTVDQFLAISAEVASRIHRVYGREAVVVQPPTSVDRFGTARHQSDGYLVISRLNRYKRVEVAIAACSQLNVPLTVIGEGPERGRLQAIAGPTIRFMGAVDDRQISSLLSRACAVIVTAEEDWGLVAIEAAAAACPTLAAEAGGNKETVLDGVTGYLYPAPYGTEQLAAAMRRLEERPLRENDLRQHAAKFSLQHFVRRLRDCVNEQVDLAAR